VNLDAMTRELVELLRAGDQFATVNDSVDAVVVPCLLVLWAETYLEPSTFCSAFARPAIHCLAGRIDAPSGRQTLDALVLYTLARLGGLYQWERVTAPDRHTIAGVDYLGQRVILRVPVTLPAVAPWPRVPATV
jgi:hypothetical protein